MGIGSFKDDVVRLEAAADYLGANIKYTKFCSWLKGVIDEPKINFLEIKDKLDQLVYGEVG